MGWSETCRCGVLGIACNKPMRVPSPIPFKSQLDELIFWQRVFSLPETAWPHEFQTSNDSVYGQIIGLIHTWNSVLFYSFRNTESSCKIWQRELNTYIICGRGPVAATVGLFNDMRQYIKACISDFLDQNINYYIHLIFPHDMLAACLINRLSGQPVLRDHTQ